MMVPKKLLSDMYNTEIEDSEVEDMAQENPEQTAMAQDTPPEAQDQIAPAGEVGI